jgi:hypothetical protein
MPKFRNTSRHQTYDFVKKGGKVDKNNVPETVSIGPGQEADLDLDLNDPQVAAAVAFGDLRSTESVEQRAAASIATEEPAGRRPRS